MMDNSSQWTVFKLGGSLLSSSHSENNIEFNFTYALNFLHRIKSWKQEGRLNKVAVIVGGGLLNQRYLDSTKEFVAKNIDAQHTIPTKMQDQIGIAAIALNAHTFLPLASAIFSEEKTFANVIKYNMYENLEEIELRNQHEFIVGGASKPGHSSDMLAIQLAIFLNTKQIISLKNVNGVYTDDPNKNPKAEHKPQLSWDDYKNILGGAEYQPRSHFPVDVKSTQVAAENNLQFIITDGNDLANLNSCLHGQKFIGSVIG